MAQIKDLIVNGVGRFIGKLYASEFIGKLTGNADTATSATKAAQDESGNNIKSSYASSISISDHTITLKNKNGASLGTVTVPDNNTDTKVTAVGNHYTPSGGTTTSASGGTLTDITNSSSGVQVVTGVTKDAAGHITGVTSVALKSVNTTYSSLKNPYALTIQGNGTTLTNGTYDGSAAKTVNITPSSIGAAATSHTHSYLPLSGGTVTGATQFNNYLKLNAWSGYGTGTANFWYDANNKFVEIQNATDLKLAGTKVSKEGHTHTTTIATSTGTNQLTLAFGTKYAITAGGSSYIFTMPSNPNTDTKVTAVGNHYTPSGGTTTSASGGTVTDITNGTGVQVVTGVTKDAAGHVTGVTSVGLKSVNTNTWTAMKGATSTTNGSVGYVNAVPPKDGYNTKFLRADGTWSVPSYPSVGNGTITITQNGTTKGTFTMNQSGNTTIALTDTDKDTHYTAKLVTGNSETNTNNNGSLTNGNVFLNLIENNTVRSSHKITGSGATAVTTDTDGNIVINTPQSNISALNIVSGNEIRFNLNGGMSGTDELYINYKFADGTQASKIKTYKFLTGNGDEVANVKAYLDWSYIKNKEHTHSSILDSVDGKPITLSYQHAALNHDNMTWLACWSGHELYSINKNEFAKAGHTHNYLPSTGGIMTGSLIFHDSKPRSQISWNSKDSRLEIATGPNSYILIKDGYTGVTSNVEAALTSNNGAISVKNNVISISCASSISIIGGGPLYINKEWTKTSDKNLKNNITSLDDRFDTLFDNLKPVKYNLILDNSNKEYYGFIAQDIEDCLSNANIDINTSGIIDIQELNKREQRTNNDGELEDVENSVTNYLLDKGITKKYGLNYDGFISLLVDQVQKLKSRIEELENRLNERGI